jgi:hypothetical protein
MAFAVIVGLLFVLFGTVGLISRRAGRSLIPGAPFHELSESAYAAAIAFGIAWASAMGLLALLH